MLCKKRKLSKKASHESHPTQSLEQKSIETYDENRELTHEEIWDDSALIDAWNAAAEEYDEYHGLSKAQVIYQSSLWHNTPHHEKTEGNRNQQDLPPNDHNNSHPLDFHAFVPTTGSSIPMGSLHAPEANPYQANSRELISRDEAFSRAMGAMYWSGYWTAMYHASFE